MAESPCFLCFVCRDDTVTLDDLAVGPWGCGKCVCQKCMTRLGEEKEPAHVNPRIQADIDDEDQALTLRSLGPQMESEG